MFKGVYDNTTIERDDIDFYKKNIKNLKLLGKCQDKKCNPV